ncbi:DNA polymerase/3'-5' exonuclease PolX [Novipirellula aureliae]|uniref:DNA polymerase beta n=1 Tax=Novipirellula aureliae TaxID=2527966 RepID=A0A5C6E382_9BACT|nr:DNA polymerase/3'-5' exonuclease PolX [Novipirellula aureliae]TWU41619.1 DNA polymerase/3'-5' exonuclease PolX [Novipirellula aureliae]
MENTTIADLFDEMADLMEFRSENPFRIRAYRGGAQAIRDLDEPIAAIADDPNRELADLPGIGKTLAEKTMRLLESGTFPQLEELREAIPPIVIQISRIPGLGAKKAAKLYELLDIESLDDLKRACQEGLVSKLKGFGAKTETMILDGLQIAKQASERIYWATGDELATTIGDYMKTCTAIEMIEWAGSYRRGRETIGDLDLLVVASDRTAAMDFFESFSGRSGTIMRGDTKISIRVAKAFQVDMRLVDADQFGAALQYFTGSQAHNIHLRKLAKERDLKINEYGVFRNDDGSKVAGDTEQSVYQSVGLPWIAPELREDRDEFEWARNDALPELIELSDIVGDLHMHTTATDGNASIREMADAAIKRGLQYIAITDHSKRVTMASGLDAERLRQQWLAIDEIRKEYDGRLQILKGIECDILEKGGMDLPDDCLAEADWVLASVHYGQKQSREQISERILGAIENPHVDCIAHPTGRLINRRPAYDADMEAIMKSAKSHNKWLELNANPARLDLNDIHLAAARRHGIPIVINTDAHSVDGLNVMKYGIKQARRGGLTKRDVANTKSWIDW